MRNIAYALTSMDVYIYIRLKITRAARRATSHWNFQLSGKLGLLYFSSLTIHFLVFCSPNHFYNELQLSGPFLLLTDVLLSLILLPKLPPCFISQELY